LAALSSPLGLSPASFRRLSKGEEVERERGPNRERQRRGARGSSP